MSTRPRPARAPPHLSFCGVRLHRLGAPPEGKRRRAPPDDVNRELVDLVLKLTLASEFSKEFNDFLRWMKQALSNLLAGFRLEPTYALYRERRANSRAYEVRTADSPVVTEEADRVLATADSRRNLRVWLQRAAQSHPRFDESSRPSKASIQHGLHLWFLHSAEIAIPPEFQDRAVLDVLLELDFGVLKLYRANKDLNAMTTRDEQVPTMDLLTSLLFTERERNYRPPDVKAWISRTNKLALARLHILRTRLAAALLYREMQTAVAAGLRSHTGGPRLVDAARMLRAPQQAGTQQPARASLDFTVACLRVTGPNSMYRELTCSACVSFHGIDLGRDIVAQLRAAKTMTLPPLTGTSGLIRYANNYDTPPEFVDLTRFETVPYDTLCAAAAKSWAHLATLFVKPLQNPTKFAWRLLGESPAVDGDYGNYHVNHPCAVARFDCGTELEQQFVRLVFSTRRQESPALPFVIADFENTGSWDHENPPETWQMPLQTNPVRLDGEQTPQDPLMCTIGSSRLVSAQTDFPSEMFNPDFYDQKHQYYRGMPLSVALQQQFDLSTATVVEQAYFSTLGLDLDSALPGGNESEYEDFKDLQKGTVRALLAMGEEGTRLLDEWERKLQKVQQSFLRRVRRFERRLDQGALRLYAEEVQELRQALQFEKPQPQGPVNQLATPQLVMDCVNQPLSVAKGMLDPGYEDIPGVFLALGQTETGDPETVIMYNEDNL
jgi:hypothetical protein